MQSVLHASPIQAGTILMLNSSEYLYHCTVLQQVLYCIVRKWDWPISTYADPMSYVRCPCNILQTCLNFMNGTSLA